MKKSLRDFLKNASLFLAVIFLAFHSEKALLLFNYRLLSEFAHDATHLYSDPIETSQPAPAVQGATTNFLPDIVTIPSIGIEAPLILSESTNNEDLLLDLDLGIVHYPGSSSPGERGQTVLLGHSAPEGWPKIKHDWVFSDIENLSTGQLVVIRFQGKQYTYSITGHEILNQGQELATDLNSNIRSLVLISCWPPGKNYKRIAVTAELITIR